MNNKIKKHSSLYYLAALIFIVFASCNNSDKNLATIKMLDESIVVSTRIVHAESQHVYDLFEERRKDFSYRGSIEVWYPKAMNLKKISGSLVEYISSIQKKLVKEKLLNMNDAIQLHRMLIGYRDSIFNIDETIKPQFGSFIRVISESFDTLKYDDHNFYNTFFTNSPKETSLAILNKFKNNVRISEKAICDYMFSRTELIKENWPSYSSLIFQNKSYIKTGDTLEIGAGLGAFSTENLPVIKINGQNIKLDIDGVANYKLIGGDKLGKQAIPVEIGFTDNEGKKHTIKKIITYTVEK